MRNPLRRLACLAPGVGLALLATTAVAQDPCSCIEHVATEQLYHGCRLSKGRNDFYPTALGCRANDDAPDAKPRPPITVDDKTWREVPAGQDRCVPCEPQRRTKYTGPRSPELEPEPAGSSE